MDLKVGTVVAYLVGVSFLPTELPSAGGLVAAFGLAWGLGGLRDRRVLLGLLPALPLAAWLPGRELWSTAYALAAGAFFFSRRDKSLDGTEDSLTNKVKGSFADARARIKDMVSSDAGRSRTRSGCSSCGR